MCGRFIQILNPEVIKLTFPELEIGVALPSTARPRYNIAPGQDILTVLNTTPPKLIFTRWGLVPSWAKDPQTGYSMINARAETLSTKPSFREPLKKRRCLIFTDGFYEWRRTDKKPFFIHMKDGKPFAFAGLWEQWQGKDGGEPLNSSTIITTCANPLIETIHDRMPVILAAHQYRTWLTNTALHEQELTQCLRTYPPEAMEAYAVSTLVNKPQNDSPGLIEPIPD